jgi:hypothetical protein
MKEVFLRLPERLRGYSEVVSSRLLANVTPLSKRLVTQ